MNQKEVVITFETIYDILRAEKTHEDLQKLDQEFLKDVSEYLREKQQLYQESFSKTDIFSANEKENLQIQLNNIKRVVKEIYERRESKILTLAMNRARIGSDTVDTSALLEDEKTLFHHLVTTLEIHRSHLRNLIECNSASIPIHSEKKSEINTQKEKEKIEVQLNTSRIRFLTSTDQFIGSELEEYGPFEEGSEADIPSNLAEILISEGKAVKI